MAKLITSDLSNLASESSAVTNINANFNAVEVAMEKTLSRDGTAPNQMQADLDMNLYDILNVDTIYANSIIPSEIIVTIVAELTLESISTLRLYDTLNVASGSTGYVKSYYAGLRKGGGYFQLDLSDTTTVDDGGVNIRDANNRLWKRIYESQLDASMFGAKGDGTTDDSTSMYNFYNYCCLLVGSDGYIPAGNYSITPGTLVFDNAQTTKNFPNIATAGYNAVTFTARSAVNAPMLSFTNGTAAAAIGYYWKGGSHGGLSVVGSNTALANQHALLLRGVEGTKFGYIRGTSMGGDTVHIEQKLYATTNPDPYHVASCTFDGIEGYLNKGMVLNNRNYVGFSGCFVYIIRAILCEGGVFYGFGTANRIDFMSVGSCKGRAIDQDSNITGGTSNRFSLGVAELDDPEYGVRIGKCQGAVFGQFRVNHRYNFTALNPSGGYWPRVAIDIASPSGGTAAASDIVMPMVIHRIEAGGAKGDMGVFTELNNSGAAGRVHINHSVLDNAALGFVNTDLFQNVNTSSTVRIERDEVPILDSTIKPYFRASATTIETVSTTGFGAAAGKIAFPTEASDRSGMFLAGREVRVATTAALPANTYTAGVLTASANGALAAQDGITLVVLDRILVKNEAAGANNGVYYVSAIGDGGNPYTLTRTLDADTAAELEAGGGLKVWVRAGTVNQKLTFICSATTITLGTTDITWISSTGATSEATIPYSGPYSFEASVAINAASGTRVRMALTYVRSGATASAAAKSFYMQATAVQVISMSGTAEFTAGDTVFISVDQNTAAAVNLSALLSTSAENYFSMTALT